MSQPYVGEIRLVGFNFAPVGWERCSGQLLPIAENDVLFTLIGTTYGGDGETTFALPNLCSRLPLHTGSGGGGSYALGEAAGAESVTLSAAQLPSHSHSALATTGLADQGTPGGVVPAQAPTVQVYAEDTPVLPLAASAVSSVGSSQPHENAPPYLVVNFIISLFGIYPTPS